MNRCKCYESHTSEPSMCGCPCHEREKTFNVSVFLHKGGTHKGVAKNIQVANGLLIVTNGEQSVEVFPLANVARYKFSPVEVKK